MTCIYYQDELGICGKKEGFSWDKDFEPFRCDYEHDMSACPEGITRELAEKAVKFYRKMHTPPFKEIDEYYHILEDREDKLDETHSSGGKNEL